MDDFVAVLYIELLDKSLSRCIIDWKCFSERIQVETNKNNLRTALIQFCRGQREIFLRLKVLLDMVNYQKTIDKLLQNSLQYDQYVENSIQEISRNICVIENNIMPSPNVSLAVDLLNSFTYSRMPSMVGEVSKSSVDNTIPIMKMEPDNVDLCLNRLKIHFYALFKLSKYFHLCQIQFNNGKCEFTRENFFKVDLLYDFNQYQITKLKFYVNNNEVFNIINLMNYMLNYNLNSSYDSPEITMEDENNTNNNTTNTNSYNTRNSKNKEDKENTNGNSSDNNTGNAVNTSSNNKDNKDDSEKGDTLVKHKDKNIFDVLYNMLNDYLGKMIMKYLYKQAINYCNCKFVVFQYNLETVDDDNESGDRGEVEYLTVECFVKYKYRYRNKTYKSKENRNNNTNTVNSTSNNSNTTNTSSSSNSSNDKYRDTEKEKKEQVGTMLKFTRHRNGDVDLNVEELDMYYRNIYNYHLDHWVQQVSSELEVYQLRVVKELISRLKVQEEGLLMMVKRNVGKEESDNMFKYYLNNVEELYLDNGNTTNNNTTGNNLSKGNTLSNNTNNSNTSSTDDNKDKDKEDDQSDGNKDSRGDTNNRDNNTNCKENRNKEEKLVWVNRMNGSLNLKGYQGEFGLVEAKMILKLYRIIKLIENKYNGFMDCNYQFSNTDQLVNKVRCPVCVYLSNTRSNNTNTVNSNTNVEMDLDKEDDTLDKEEELDNNLVGVLLGGNKQMLNNLNGNLHLLGSYRIYSFNKENEEKDKDGGDKVDKEQKNKDNKSNNNTNNTNCKENKENGEKEKKNNNEDLNNLSNLNLESRFELVLNVLVHDYFVYSNNLLLVDEEYTVLGTVELMFVYYPMMSNDLLLRLLPVLDKLLKLELMSNPTEELKDKRYFVADPLDYNSNTIVFRFTNLNFYVELDMNGVFQRFVGKKGELKLNQNDNVNTVIKSLLESNLE